MDISPWQSNENINYSKGCEFICTHLSEYVPRNWDGSMIWQGGTVRGSSQQSVKSAKIELVMCPAMLPILPVHVALS